MAKDKDASKKPKQKPQHQTEKPGVESKMTPKPKSDSVQYKGSDKLRGKVALITGGDSGIGKAVAIAYAKEGADIIISYLKEDEDAIKTMDEVKSHGVRCICLAGDIGSEKFCQRLVKLSIEKLGKLDILVNNAGEHYCQEKFENITAEQLEKTFRTNIFSFFYLTKAALPYLKRAVPL